MLSPSIFSNNDYSEIGGLQLDMAPVIVENSQNYKEIRIEKNDNAEGTIEFLPEAQSFIGKYRNSSIDSEVAGLQLDIARL